MKRERGRERERIEERKSTVFNEKKKVQKEMRSPDSGEREKRGEVKIKNK